MRTAQPDLLIFRLDHIIVGSGHIDGEFTLVEHRTDVFSFHGSCPHCRFVVHIETEASERLVNRVQSLKRACGGKKNRGLA